jgi:hypothetical protein
MELLFEIDQHSDYGPQVAYLLVEIKGETAYITNFDDEITETKFDSISQLIEYVYENHKEAFMTADETQISITAQPDIEQMVRNLLWEYEGDG